MERARLRGWDLLICRWGHDAQVIDPDALARLLVEIASGPMGKAPDRDGSEVASATSSRPDPPSPILPP